jgi:hypothetical protein
VAVADEKESTSVLASLLESKKAPRGMIVQDSWFPLSCRAHSGQHYTTSSVLINIFCSKRRSPRKTLAIFKRLVGVHFELA